MNIESHNLLTWILVGLIAGLLASRVMVGHGMGILMDIVVGIVGAFLGSWLATQAGITLGGPGVNGTVKDIIIAFVGALVLLALLRLVGFGRHRRRAI